MSKLNLNLNSVRNPSGTNYYFRMRRSITDFDEILSDYESAGVVINPVFQQRGSCYRAQLSGELIL